MKAEQTRHLIEVALRQILNLEYHLTSNSVIYAHEDSALKELAELERLAEIGKVVEWALKTKRFVDDFEFNMLDIDFVVTLYRNLGKETNK